MKKTEIMHLTFHFVVRIKNNYIETTCYNGSGYIINEASFEVKQATCVDIRLMWPKCYSLALSLSKGVLVKVGYVVVNENVNKGQPSYEPEQSTQNDNF